MNRLWPGAADVPQLPFRRLFTRLDRPVPEGAEIVTAYTDGTVTARSNRDKERYHEAADLSTYQGVRVGDFVVHGLDIMRGSVGVSDSAGAMSPVCTVCRPTDLAEPRYMAYAIRLMAESDYPKALARGVRDGGADFRRWETLASLPLPAPPVTEQAAIADFLDRETAKIDALIEKQRELLERLPARVEAVIDSFVTGYPRVPIRRDAKAITSGSRDWAQYYSESGTPFLRITNLPRRDVRLRMDDLQHVQLPSGGAEGERTRCESDDLLFSITAYLGSVALVPAELAGSFISQHVCLVRLRRNIWDPRFAALAALSTTVQDQLAEGAYGGTKIQLSLPDIASLELPAPDLSVQHELANRIQRELGHTALVRDRVERHIALAQERRNALITAAVTGQLEIPAA